jgi:hypothetical protein
MMSVKNALKLRFQHMLWAAMVIMIVIWLMSVLECNMATPAY